MSNAIERAEHYLAMRKAEIIRHINVFGGYPTGGGLQPDEIIGDLLALLKPQEESSTMRLYTIAYRDQHNQIRSWGRPTPYLEAAKEDVLSANAGDQGVVFFVAYLDDPQWQELSNVTPT